MKIIAIIQARVGSTRLPGKVLKKLSDKTVLNHVVERVNQSQEIDNIIIATSNLEKDNLIEKECKKIGVSFFRGSENDVLSRYYNAAKENNADVVVRITSDCPLIDPNVIDEIVRFYKEENYDVVTNAGSELMQRTYPRGLDTEIFSFEQLEVAFLNAEEKYQREHVTPYIYENSNEIFYYKNNIDYSQYRWTLDTQEDFKLISTIYEKFYRGKHNFYMKDIINFLSKHPQIACINQHIEQKKIKEV